MQTVIYSKSGGGNGEYSTSVKQLMSFGMPLADDDIAPLDDLEFANSHASWSLRYMKN